jgi:hypothetical protein
VIGCPLPGRKTVCLSLLILYTRGALRANLLKNLATEVTEVTEEYLIKSFCRGPGGGFFKKNPLAAGGNQSAIAAIQTSEKYAGRT